MKEIKTLDVDTTATAVLVMATPDCKPSQEEIDTALKSLRCKVTKLEKVERPKPAAVYELRVDGVG